MAPLTVEDFRHTLAAATTPTSEDALNFQRMLQELNVAPASEHIILHLDSSPGRTFQQALLDFIENSVAKSDSEHNLIILHYAGHGMMKGGSLTWAETSWAKKLLNADTCLLNYINDAVISDSDRLDVLLILDCCYGHGATRAPTLPRRVVEVIAATSTRTPLTGLAPNNTLTAKIAAEITRRRRSGHRHVEFTDVFQSLKSRGDTIRPTHSLLVGVASVLLPLNGPGNIDPASIPPTTQHCLAAWVRNLPRSTGLTIERVYRTQSMCLIMRSALSVYAKLHGLEGYALIAENSSPPLNLNGLLQPSPCSTAPKKENFGFGGGK
ncbi:hypothetical protein BO94DRAFT_587606 [Aspergillus sclerotioniger CBS 115572]|uniref:Peptidase C14 caspase domain-containing protein n=1 Tax=Aspergillus sclerotioniger CBS 115572 TaxID=1450535 RepID=A0A317W5H6_9EURO|nr:hypothetical protein BO94DRAFT_587606 [Aspergillus sclerotioniger CBS 115572]PWY80861.1 hypothetical protein BO94DRAFT_587606 [Aspergillus sclerotioniger CBS 115572]